MNDSKLLRPSGHLTILHAGKKIESLVSFINSIIEWPDKWAVKCYICTFQAIAIQLPCHVILTQTCFWFFVFDPAGGQKLIQTNTKKLMRFEKSYLFSARV